MPEPDLARYEVFALRYARRDGIASEHFLGADPHDGPSPMDYFVWLIRNEARTIVVDCGFTADVAAKRGREYLRCPVKGLSLLGVAPEEVDDLVLTHLHYDHVGNLDKFPKATFHLQEPDLHFAVGRHMRHRHMRAPFELDDVLEVVRLNYAGRVHLYDGIVELHPGITLHPAPGHSAGLQFVRVNTVRGAVVLASDAAHFYETYELGRPFPICVSVAESLESYERLKAAAPSPEHIVPGHDPLVMGRYPAPSPDLEGIAVRLDTVPAAAGRAL